MRYGSNASRSSSVPRFFRGVSAAAIALGIVAMLLIGPSVASASEPLSNVNVSDATLQVNKQGIALVTYRTQQGAVRHVLVWGAINANAPSPDVPQVRFKYDYSGGWKSRHNANYWKTFKNACAGNYDGPTLQLVVATCKAPDGSYWALQSWQRGAAASRLQAVDGRAVGVGAPRLALVGAARRSSTSRRTGRTTIRRKASSGSSSIMGKPGLRLQVDCGRQPARPLRAERLHRHAQLGLRDGLVSRVGDLDAQPDRHLLPFVRPAEAVPQLPVEGDAAGRPGRPVPLHDHGAGRHAGHPDRDPRHHAAGREARPR